MNNDHTLIYPGGEVKALGSGRVAGYLVRYNAVDVQGDVFLPTTDYGLDVAAKSRVVYDHGLKRDDLGRKLGSSRVGTVDITGRDDGLWAEGELDVSKPDVKALYDRVEAGKIGWSSGSVERLVVREPHASNPRVREVKSWPLIEATLTPVPVDPNNRALAIKALTESPTDATATGTLVESSERLVSDAAELVPLWEAAVKARASEGRNLSGAKRAALADLHARLGELVAVTRPRATDAERLEVKRLLIGSMIRHG